MSVDKSKNEEIKKPHKAWRKQFKKSREKQVIFRFNILALVLEQTTGI